MPKSAKPTVRYDKYTTITQKCRKITPGKDYREKCGLGANNRQFAVQCLS
jgi:hypothetical protein